MKSLTNYEDVSEAFDKLFPLCRSILGEGYRDSLNILEEYIPFEEEFFASGEKVLNWYVPKEWVIREAWIENQRGDRVLDFEWNNLHVINYSAPVEGDFELNELKKHIYVSQVDDDAIPYTTSYYKERWGFCMSSNMLKQLPEGIYHAYIDSEFIDGNLVTGEVVIPGECQKEILITSYLCHPSMANNELSGPLVQAMLYQKILGWNKRKYTYRFLINPETIGSIAYLSKHYKELEENVFGGLVLTCLGGEENLRLKYSRRGMAPFDLLVKKINSENKDEFRVEQFDPSTGSDERQYCSPGFNLPISQISRKVYGQYKEYHTSLDSKELMGINNIIDSANRIEEFLKIHEKERYYMNMYPNGEIKLGDYNLYPSVNTNGDRRDDSYDLINETWFVTSVMTILNYSDGSYPLSYIAKKCNIDEEMTYKVAEILVNRGLLKRII